MPKYKGKQFDDISEWSYQRAIVKTNNKYGMIDTNGNLVLDVIYEGIYPLSYGFPTIVRQYGKLAYVDANGKFLTNFTFDDARWFSDGLAAVQKRGYWGFIDMSGDLVIKYDYVSVCDFKEGVAQVRVDTGWWGYIDRNEKWIISPYWDESADCTYGRILLNANHNYCFADKNGHYVTPIIFMFANKYNYEGYTAVRVYNDIFGYIDFYGFILK